MKVFKSTFVYLLSTVAVNIVPFILLPFLTEALSSSEYGKIALFNTSTATLVTIVGFSLHGVVIRYYYESKSKEDYNSFIFSCLIIAFSIFWLFFVILLVFSQFISNFLLIDNSWLFMALLVSLSTGILNILLAKFQVNKKPLLYGAFSIFSALLNGLLAYYFVIINHGSANDRIEAYVISAIIILLLSLFFLLNKSSWNIKNNIDNYKYIFSFCLPLLPHAIAMLILTSYDKVIISKLLSDSSLGIYMVAFQVSSVIAVFFQAANKAITPWIYDLLATDDGKKELTSKYLLFSFIAFVVVSILAYYITPFVLSYVISPQYERALNIVAGLSIAQVFYGGYMISSNILFFYKKNKYIPLLSLFSGVVNIFLLFHLVPMYGLSGAMFAFLIGKVIHFTLTIFTSFFVLKKISYE